VTAADDALPARRGRRTAPPGAAPLVRSLPPVVAPGARVLILGSMPGAASLAAGRYYAHPRNAFWPIMGALVGAGPALPYPERLAVLTSAGVALWDVLATCRRAGSLDQAIRDEVPNDLAAFLAAHPRLGLVGLNGAKAAASFRRHAGAALPPGVAAVTLPSTSPAHAGLPFAAKLARWRAALPLRPPDAP
jgi:TDG/mug DNA glycosylase family protein